MFSSEEHGPIWSESMKKASSTETERMHVPAYHARTVSQWSATRKPSVEVTPITSATLSSCCSELWPMTLTFKLDLNSVKVNQHVKYPGQRSFSSRVIDQTPTHQIDCSTWTTNVVGGPAALLMLSQHCQGIKILKSQHHGTWYCDTRQTQTWELHSEPRYFREWLRTTELAAELHRSGSSRPSNRHVQNVTSCSDFSLFTTIWTHVYTVNYDQINTPKI